MDDLIAKDSVEPDAAEIASIEAEEAAQEKPTRSARAKRQLELLARKDDPKAVEELIESVKYLVVDEVNRFARHRPCSDEDVEDLQSAAHIALLEKAIPKFDLKFDCAFSTYAIWWIRHAIQRWWQDHGRTVRTPVHLHDRKRTDARLANLDPASLKAAIIHAARSRTAISSLNETVDEDGELERIDLLVDANPINADDTIEENRPSTSRQGRLRAAFDRLPPREREIMGLRLQEITLEEIGERLGVTRERVRQLEEIALGRLKADLCWLPYDPGKYGRAVCERCGLEGGRERHTYVRNGLCGDCRNLPDTNKRATQTAPKMNHVDHAQKPPAAKQEPIATETQLALAKSRAARQREREAKASALKEESQGQAQTRIGRIGIPQAW